jgi:hypothetical protein
MPNANWSNPTLTSTYTNFVSEVKNRDEDLALQFDGTTSTNIPVGAIRWDSSANRWKKWNGSSWVELTSTYALTALTTTGSVGIGTSVPASALDVSGGSIKLRNASSGTNFGYEVDVNHTTGVSQKILTARYMIAGQSGSYIDIASINAEMVNAGANEYGLSLRTGSALTSRLWIAPSGNVGIGTSSPQAPLHVIGVEGVRVESTTSSDGHIRFINTSGSMSIGMSGAVGNNLLIYDRTNNQSVYNYIGGASGYHAWNVNNTERFRIDSSGRVGIGTSSPVSKLSVTDTVAITALAGTQSLLMGNQNSTGASGPCVISSGGRNLLFGVGDSWAAANGGTLTEYVRINDIGRVGIGTSSPSALLHVAGDAQIQSLNGGALAGTRNRLINGSMAIDQRNAGASQTFTAAAALAYSVDRWYGYSTGANVTGQRVQGATVGQFRYQFTGAASVTAIGFGQRIEQINSADLAGTTATLSVDLANSVLTTVTWTAFYANTADTFGTRASPTRTQIATGAFTVNSTVTRYDTQISIPAAATTGIEIVFTVGAQTSGTWTIGDVQLERGSVGTPFERRSYGQELALCQRYHWRNANAYFPNTVSMMHYFKVEMRTTPTVTWAGAGPTIVGINSGSFNATSSSNATDLAIASAEL